MTNTRFNKLWELLHHRDFIKFTDNGETSTLHRYNERYGSVVSLKSENGNTVLVHYDKERFREILVD